MEIMDASCVTPHRLSAEDHASNAAILAVNNDIAKQLRHPRDGTYDSNEEDVVETGHLSKDEVLKSRIGGEASTKRVSATARRRREMSAAHAW